jgi:hypothetical protein
MAAIIADGMMGNRDMQFQKEETASVHICPKPFTVKCFEEESHHWSYLPKNC